MFHILSLPNRAFAKGMVAFEGEGGIDVDGKISLSLGIGLEYIKKSKTFNPYIKGITGVSLEFGANANLAFDASIGLVIQSLPCIPEYFCSYSSHIMYVRKHSALSANVKVDAIIDNYGNKLSITAGLNPKVNYYVSCEKALIRDGFQRVSSIGALADEISVAIKGQVVAEIWAEFAKGLGE